MDSRRCRRSLGVDTFKSPMVDKGMEERRGCFGVGALPWSLVATK